MTCTIYILAPHFLRDFLTRSILFYFSVPPIRALQGRNTRRLSQCLYNACQAALRLPRRAAAEKGVKHNAAFRTARLDTGFGKFWRERGEMPAL